MMSGTRTHILMIALVAAALVLAACGDDGDGHDHDHIDASEVDAPDGDGDAQTSCGADPLYSECTSNDQCDSCLCFTYGMGQMLCSKECEVDDDCPAPSDGCNNMGICRRPQ